ADSIDQAGDTLSAEVNLLHQGRSDDLLIFDSGARHSGVDVRDALLGAEASQRTPQGNTLFELPELGRLEFAVQFLLSGKDDLEQLAAPVFEIAQQTDLFKHVPIEVMRFVDDQHGRASRCGALQQHIVQRQEYFRLREPVAAQVEIVRQHLEELRNGQP